ncbi:MAG: FAD-dependent oxidoreductase [Burkholderiaceae bacterium]
MNLCIVGGGWAGMAAAATAVERGWHVTLLEATRQLGGRARGMVCRRPDGLSLNLDNGQHILIGAYFEALSLMHRTGVEVEQDLLGIPLAMPFPDGKGIQTPAWATSFPSPLNAVVAIATARGWSWSQRWALVQRSTQWQGMGFACPEGTTVAELCQGLPDKVMQELVEPLCVSALNLPTGQACGQVFLRVMRDALFGTGFPPWSGSTLLLPRVDLSALFPAQAANWLRKHHEKRFDLRLGTRVSAVQRRGTGWSVHGENWSLECDGVIWATAASPAAKAMAQSAAMAKHQGQEALALGLSQWAADTAALEHTAIATVYTWTPGLRLPKPMLALRPQPSSHESPAQFVFDRGQLHPHDASMQGVLAFVVSAAEGERDDLQRRVEAQARRQLGLKQLEPILTVVEKRATFACTPSLKRPAQEIAKGLQAAGDFVSGPYPATLEGAVRSAHSAVLALKSPYQ